MLWAPTSPARSILTGEAAICLVLWVDVSTRTGELSDVYLKLIPSPYLLLLPVVRLPSFCWYSSTGFLPCEIWGCIKLAPKSRGAPPFSELKLPSIIVELIFETKPISPQIVPHMPFTNLIKPLVFRSPCPQVSTAYVYVVFLCLSSAQNMVGGLLPAPFKASGAHQVVLHWGGLAIFSAVIQRSNTEVNQQQFVMWLIIELW